MKKKNNNWVNKNIKRRKILRTDSLKKQLETWNKKKNSKKTEKELNIEDWFNSKSPEKKSKQ